MDDSRTTPGPQNRDLGIALSGGGVRAALFSVGVLLYLTRAGIHRRVRMITSVSGGSIVNAAVAAKGDFSQMEPDEFEELCSSLAQELAKKGAFFMPGWKDLSRTAGIMALSLIVPLVAVFVLDEIVDGAGDWSALGTVTMVMVGYIVLYLLAGVILLTVARRRAQQTTYARVLAKAVGGPSPRERRKQVLSDLPVSTVDHVIVGTELVSGAPIYFSRDWILSPTYGWGEPRARVVEAIYGSAAFVGAFPPLRIKVAKLKLGGGSANSDRPRQFLVADGGVYNNLGNDWFNFARDTASKPWAVDHRFKATVPTAMSRQLIVNSSAPPKIRQLPRHWIMGRNVLGFARIVTVLYENTLRPRIDALIEEGYSEGSVVLDIAMSPLELAEAIERHNEAEDVRARARTACTVLGGLSDQYWSEFSGRTSSLRTTLKSIGVDRAARLIRHGYLNAQVAFYSVEGGPGFDDALDERWFIDLVEGTPRRSSEVDGPESEPADPAESSADGDVVLCLTDEARAESPTDDTHGVNVQAR